MLSTCHDGLILDQKRYRHDRNHSGCMQYKSHS